MKKITLFTLIATLFVSSVSLAAPVKVVGAQAELLKKSIMIHDFDCRHVDADELKSRVSLAQTVMLDTSGSQPAIIFYHDLKRKAGDPIEREAISITATRDFKRLANIRYEFQEWKEVNIGTVISPEIVKTFVSKDDAIGCAGN